MLLVLLMQSYNAELDAILGRFETFTKVQHRNFAHCTCPMLLCFLNVHVFSFGSLHVQLEADLTSPAVHNTSEFDLDD